MRRHAFVVKSCCFTILTTTSIIRGLRTFATPWAGTYVRFLFGNFFSNSLRARLEQLEIAKQFYCQAVKLAPSNMRALYGLLLTTSQLAANPKCPQVSSSHWFRCENIYYRFFL
jgi:hypothetical protein